MHGRVALLRVAWRTGAVALVVVPLFAAGVAGAGEPVPHRIAALTGVLATSVLVAAVVLPSRLSYLNLAFGIESVLRSHRRAGLLALGAVLVHVAAVVATDPRTVELFDARTAPDRARAATLATAALVVLCVLAISRRARRHYPVWRLLHVGLALTVLLGGALHIFWLDHLIRNAAVRDVLALIALGLAAMLAYRWLWEPFASRAQGYVIREVVEEGPAVSTVVLEPRHGWQAGLKFAPGQFAWVRLDRPFALREEHPFTIASGAHDHREVRFTVREAGDFTRRLRGLEPGRVVYLDGPHGSFTVDAHRTDGVVMVCAGVGITPMISMLRTLAHRGDTRQHLLVSAARTEDDLLFRAELADLQRVLDLVVVEVLSAPAPGWTGWCGRVDEYVLGELIPRRHRARLEYFLCGPPAMVARAADALRRLGVDRSRVHTEQFDMT